MSGFTATGRWQRAGSPNSRTVSELAPASARKAPPRTPDARPSSEARSGSRFLPGRLTRHLPDLMLLAFVAIQLLPFLSAFHQAADDNFWQYVTLTELDSPWDLAARLARIAEDQGRIGMYPAMPLVLLGTMLPEYAWGRLLVVLCFGLTLLAFCHLFARRFRLPLTRAALLLTACILPMAAHHLPPNAYPLMLTLPLLALLAIHLRLARAGELSVPAALAAGLGLFAVTMLLEYALVEGFGLALLALMAARARRGREIRVHGAALLASAAVHFGYRLAFPSHYPGTIAEALPLADILRLQLLHTVNGTVFPHLTLTIPAPEDLAPALLLLAMGAWLAAHLLPALATRLDARLAVWVLLACLAWAWLNTLPHAFTQKYQAWCRNGDCTYVDSRLSALSLGIAAAIGLALLLQAVARHGPARARWATLFCAACLGLLGSATFLHNRASARVMAEKEGAFDLLRESACRMPDRMGHDPLVLQALSRAVLWPADPGGASRATYLATYRDALPRLGLACQPIAFRPTPQRAELLGWSFRERGGRWSLGESAVMRVPVRPDTLGAILTLSAYVPPGGAPQRITIRDAGGRACRLSLEFTKVQRVFLPWRDAAPGSMLTLLLETPDAVSPRQAGASEDGRVLGVFLSGVKPVPAAPGRGRGGDGTGGAGTDAALDLGRCMDGG